MAILELKSIISEGENLLDRLNRILKVKEERMNLNLKKKLHQLSNGLQLSCDWQLSSDNWEAKAKVDLLLSHLSYHDCCFALLLPLHVSSNSLINAKQKWR